MTAEEPNFDISAACTGAYYSAETFTAVLTFAEGSKFVFDVTEDLFVFPQGTDADVSVERIGDTQVRLTAVGLPAFTSSSFDIVVRAEAIDSPFAKDVAVHISYAHPYIGDGERTAAEDSLTVTGAAIGGGLKGTENGLSLPAYVAKWATLSQQSYDESANTYSYVLTRTERAKAQGITMQTLLEKIDLTAQLVSRYETFRYTFAAAGAIAGAAVDFALPYIYDFFGIDTTDPDIVLRDRRRICGLPAVQHARYGQFLLGATVVCVLSRGRADAHPGHCL